MSDAGQRPPKKNFANITNDSHWEILVSLLMRDFIIVDFSVISLIKVYIFSLSHRGAFTEKPVSTLKLSSSTSLGCRVICIYKTNKITIFNI